MPCSEGRGGRCWRAGSPGQGPPPGEAGRPDSSGTTPHPTPTPPAPRLALRAVPLPARSRTLRSTGQTRPLSQVVCFHFTDGKTEAMGIK